MHQFKILKGENMIIDINCLPTIDEAISFLKEAELNNPGPWIDHSYNVAEGARMIAKNLKELNPDIAYVLGLLHDIGRREGIHGMRHSIDGYNYLTNKGYKFAARICITHVTFDYEDESVIVGKWDGTESEYQFILTYMQTVTETDYDKLIKLCDYISLPNGFCLLEKRIVEMTLRSGFNELTLPRWKSIFEIKDYFEAKLGKSIYEILPNIIENTFY